jgi:hypothetical protein
MHIQKDEEYVWEAPDFRLNPTQKKSRSPNSLIPILKTLKTLL